MKELIHIRLEIAGNAMLAERRTRQAASSHFPIRSGVQPAPGIPQILKQVGLKLLDVQIIPRGAALVWDVDLRSNRARALLSTDLAKCSAFSFSMVSCFAS